MRSITISTLKREWRITGTIVSMFALLITGVAMIAMATFSPEKVSFQTTTYLTLFPILLIVFCCFMVFLGLLAIRNHQNNLKPCIHVWSHNGLTKVVAAQDFYLGIQNRERKHLTSLRQKKRRIEPRLYALFSDRFEDWSIDGVMVYTMEYFQKLEKCCVIIRSEMQVPNLKQDGAGKSAVSIEVLWRLSTNQRDAKFDNEQVAVNA